MPLVTVRVDDELKQAMEKLKYLNWSEVIRETVEHKIKEKGSTNLAEAVLLNERLRKKAPEGWDSTSVIRVWRAIRS
jgi:Arc/MetJ-type ribon-helix-helix transcriptional regulator